MSERNLAYADRFTDYLVNTLTEDTTGVTPDNNLMLVDDERQVLVLDVTGDEWRQIFSCVLQGADLLYQDTAHQVTWLYWRSASMGSFCSQVAQCILSDADVLDALEQVINDNNLGGGNGNPNEPLSESVRGEDWMEGLACTNDKLWGACQEVVDGVADATFEVLQRIELASNGVELVSALLGAIPIVGPFIETGNNIIQWAVDNAYDWFVAADSPTVRDELACLLFCLGKPHCALNFDLVEAAFEMSALSEPPIFTGLQDALEWVIDLALSGEPDTQVFASICMLGINVLKYGGKIGETLIGVRSLQQLTEIGALENASSGWSATCDGDECEFTETVLFGTNSGRHNLGLGSFVPQSNFGGGVLSTASINANPYVAGTSGNDSRGLRWQIDLEEALTVTDFAFHYNVASTCTITNPTLYAVYIMFDDVVIESVLYSALTTGSLQTITFSGSELVEESIAIMIRPCDDGTGGSGWITDFQITALGDNPWKDLESNP